MQIFVSEYLSSGAWPEPVLDGSLAREGRAMLLAVLEDLSSIDGVQVTTTWDERLGPPPDNFAEVHVVADRDEERRLFADLTASADAVYPVAPEFDHILEQRTRFVENAGKPVLGSNSASVGLCADKFRLAAHLRQHDVPTIETWKLGSPTDIDFPVVVKPRFGAGSQETYKIESAADLSNTCESIGEQSLLREAIVQPFVVGRALSVAMIVDESAHVFPPAEQILSDDGRFQYLGGRVPVAVDDLAEVQAVALQACRSVPGLRGYVGVDLIVPNDKQQSPLVVEINPRLTTSYLGYRRLTANNLAARMLPSGEAVSPIRWETGPVTFTPDGGL